MSVFVLYFTTVYLKYIESNDWMIYERWIEKGWIGNGRDLFEVLSEH
jgi:hypothetical protein